MANPAQDTVSQTPQTPPAQGTLRTNTRLITVDVVASDSHGNVVRGLKSEDFQITEEHGARQKIVRFELMDASAPPHPASPSGLPPLQPGGPRIYSNVLPERMRVPPTVMLMDALNTSLQNQSEVHRHMVMLLKTLPPSTPIAVFVLGHTLHVVQGFTTDPALLRAAVDHSIRSVGVEQNPQDDANSPSNVALDQNGGTETQVTQALEDFEKTEFEAQMAVRVDETADAMVSISNFLGGYPGRKNLLWFSESFPNWIAPSADFGSQPFLGSATYSDKIQRATQALADARIAVYPVDARGLEVNQLYNASQDPHINSNNPGAGFGGQINRDNNSRLDSQATMDQIAEQTGGKTCANNNDLSGCVQGALDDSSTYYELAYYPEGVKWDGKFHKINVKTDQHGVKLRFRAGYFARDPNALATQSPAQLLQQACRDPLPATGISVAAEALAPKQGVGDAGAARYLLAISPDSLSLPPGGPSRQLSLQVAICEYDPKGASFQFYPRDLSGPVTEAAYQGWKTTGFRNIFDFGAKPENLRLRFAVLDVPSGAIGSVDVPAHPREFGTPPVAGVPASPAANPSSAAAPASTPASPPPSHVVFRIASGASSLLDWTGDALTYHGDLGIDQGARALFQSFFGARYHCEIGNLVPNDVTSSASPNFVLTFKRPDGSRALVNLGGDAPAYSGEIPVDSSARAFFDYLWKLAHCQQP
jgi:VWFA-related protein